MTAARPLRARPPARALVALLFAALTLAALPGCASGSSYGRDRLDDLTDVIDTKYGTAYGVGAKLEATVFLGAGLGVAQLGETTESFGRDEVVAEGGGFLHFVIGGWDGLYGGACLGLKEQGSVDVLFFNVAVLAGDTPRTVDCFRLGGELLLPWLHGGLYLNTGQLFDFVVGLASFDPAHDDRSTRLARDRARAEALGEPPPPVDTEP